jgi:uncharacterized membrane protein
MTAGKPMRIEGIDVARGLASVIMIQGHAYDGWVADEHKTTASYLFTRVLGTLPLPSFLVLAGAALALRIGTAIERGERPEAVRTSLVKRGFTILVIGYLVNALSALMDGFDGLETFTRADVLQVIGLSIATVGFFGVRGDERIDPRALERAALALALVPMLLCPLLTPLGSMASGPLRHVLAPVIDVPGITQMPYVPLASWTAIGVLLSRFLVWANSSERSIAGAPIRVLVGVLGIALALLLGGSWLTRTWVEASGESLSRAHPAVITNAIELAARGVIVLAVGALLTPRLPEGLKRILLRFGRGSLVAYVFHVPFCYGALGLPIRGRLDMVEATVFVVLLEIASFGAVWARDAITDCRVRSKLAGA